MFKTSQNPHLEYKMQTIMNIKLLIFNKNDAFSKRLKTT